jgi:glycerol-3-phosphate dehydrogenase subunit B
MKELMIVGAGFSGLFSSILAASAGLSVRLVAQGRGGLSLSAGCLEIWRAKAPSRVFSTLPAEHPLSLAGKEHLYDSLSFFNQLMDDHHYSFSGSVNRNFSLPTAVGGRLTVNQAPTTMMKGELEQEQPFWLAQFTSFRDFYAEMMSAPLERSGAEILGIVDLPLFKIPTRRDSYSVDLALRFEDEAWLDEIIRAWRPKVQGLGKVGLPAVLGFERAVEVQSRLEEALNIDIFEIPTLPPSIPGLRLERILRREAEQRGVNLMEGSTAVGRVDGTTDGRRTNGIVLQTAGGPRILEADAVLLATGGILHGGIVRQQDGRFRESVFDLPLRINHHPNAMVEATPMRPQPYSLVGIGVDHQMRPLGADGDPIMENLYAVGGLLGGSDRIMEGSRQGIDLATADCAIKAMQA